MTAEMTDQERKDWLAIRKEAALEIDPETADVEWCWGQILDPYGVHPDLPPECDQVGRLYFARSPGSDVWVCFYDLPKAVCNRLWERVRAGDIYRDPSALAREAEWSRLMNELLEKRRRDDRPKQTY